MPQLEVTKHEDIRIRVRKLDSTGRTQEQIDAMAQNQLRPVKLAAHDAEFANVIAEEQSVYPKVMYRLAVNKAGHPVGDEVNPSYPMPFDLAQQMGLQVSLYKNIGKTATSPGNVIVRHAYQTVSCGVVRDDATVDVETSRKQEKALRAAGWVDRVDDIKGLPKLVPDDPFSPLPTEGGKQQ